MPGERRNPAVQVPWTIVAYAAQGRLEARTVSQGKGIARGHAIGLDEWRTSSLQRRQFVQGSVRL